MRREDYNAYMRKYMLRRYHERRARGIAFLGGKCVHCGTTKRLEFDHVNSKTKSFDLGHAWSVSEVKWWAEIKKCQLLCRKSHTAKTIIDAGNEPAKGTHGTLSACRYCKCAKCNAAKRAYMRVYMRVYRKRAKQVAKQVHR